MHGFTGITSAEGREHRERERAFIRPNAGPKNGHIGRLLLKDQLSEYGGSGSPNCCDGETGHHLLPNSLLQSTRGDASTNVAGLMTSGDNAYNVNRGACVCVKGSGHSDGEHGKIHSATKKKLTEQMMAGKRLTYESSKKMVVEAHRETFKDSKGKPLCEQKCLEAQIDNSLKKSKTGEIEVRQKDGQSRANFEKFFDDDEDLS